MDEFIISEGEEYGVIDGEHVTKEHIKSNDSIKLEAIYGDIVKAFGDIDMNVTMENRDVEGHGNHETNVNLMLK